MAEAVKKPRLARQVAASLVTSIVERNLVPGDRLPAERDLAATFAVSRHVVREALRALEARNLISIDHGRGTVIMARPTPDDLASFVGSPIDSSKTDGREELEARSVFEAGLAELIVANVTEESLQRLDSIVEALRAEVESGEPVGADDVAFHDQLLRCTGNSMLIKVGQPLVLGHLQSRLRENFRAGNESGEDVDLDEHVRIVAAIRSRDVAELRLLLRYHGYPYDSAERVAAGLLSPRQRAKAR